MTGSPPRVSQVERPIPPPALEPVLDGLEIGFDVVSQSAGGNTFIQDLSTSFVTCGRDCNIRSDSLMQRLFLQEIKNLRGYSQ